ncbi:phosphatase PAP2 family protein [Pontibacter sp. HSC-36F09]|uniref:phosphatase PAP2 family protein n=1 Tax=Pontibacter sp. HSC-36F09 TaxID=2910966 RepID=UPI00209F57B1|nr:phosphatase PAP2 family protein [Pontibacter sp. HSC-36F09]MCP2044848.1 acid phosphatase (class A) [Pontibacter sp. HSC-36F09]
MEPIYQFATPQSVKNQKAAQHSQTTKEQQPDAQHTCNKAACERQHKGASPLRILTLVLLLSMALQTAALAQTTMVIDGGKKPAKENKLDVAIRSLDDITFPEADFKRGAYLKLRTVYVDVPVSKFKLKPFPANNSAETRAELDFLLYLQKNRNAEAINRTETLAAVYYDPLTTNPTDADYTRNLNSLFYIGRDLGPWFNAEKLPVTSKVFQHVIQDATYYIFSLKNDFKRPRPYQLDSRLENLEAPGHASYPSGHSSTSHVHAYILGHIFPEYQDHFLGVASDMAFSRETRGVHYPSDSEAGKEFARQFVHKLMKSPKFRTDLEAMKAEIIQVRAASQLTKK